MSYTVRMRDNRTGIVRDLPQPNEWDEVSDYLWLDGNYADDGNRSIAFHRPFDEPEDESPPAGAYSVLCFVLADGRTVPGDQDEHVTRGNARWGDHGYTVH